MKTFSGQLKQSGISLLEVLLSLAIISIILVMAMQYFSTASNNQKLNMVRTFIGADMAALQGYSVNNNGFTSTTGSGSVTWDDLVDNGYLSKDTKSLDCTKSPCKQKTPWGDDVDLNVTGSQVTLTFPLPDSILCTNLQQSYGSTVVSCGTSGTSGTSVTVYVNGYTAST